MKGVWWIVLLFSWPELSCKHDRDYLLFHGGAAEVGGSCIEVVVSGDHYLADVGSWYDSEMDAGEEGDEEAKCLQKKELHEKNRFFGFEPARIKAVFLTHAHMDHLGRLLHLYRQGFGGKVYCTASTQKLAAIMLCNGARYDEAEKLWYWTASAHSRRKGYITAHWKNCKVGKRIIHRNELRGSLYELSQRIGQEAGQDVNPCRSCAELEIAPMMRLFEEVDYKELIAFDKKLSITFYPTGHIPGSAAIAMKILPLRKTVLFSGDVGNDIELLYNRPEVFPTADWVIMEGTYGALVRDRNYEAARHDFAQTMDQALSENKIVWIPSFALDRTQKVLHEIFQGQIKDIIPMGVPIYSPSSTADEISDLYKRWLFYPDKEGLLKKGLEGDSLFPFFIRALPFSAGTREGPAIYITTSGMLDAAYSWRLLPEMLPRSSVLLYLLVIKVPTYLEEEFWKAPQKSK
ncbi:MAG: MBL fold metallo-hydrolase [Bacteroidales bacterium]